MNNVPNLKEPYAEFDEVMEAGKKKRYTNFNEVRKMIDEVDDELINILKKRMTIIEQIGEYKKEHDLTIFQLERWQEILRSRIQWAEKLGIPRAHTEKFCQLLHEESIRIQTDLMNKK